MKSSIKIGIIGFGTVATGVVKILTGQKGLLQRRLGAALEIVQVADLDIKRSRGVSLPKGILTTDAMKVIQNPEIDVVVELIGGIEPARRFILDAMSKGKHVVTANKALLAAHGEELFEAAALHGVDIGFEGSVCGGIPVIRAMREGLAAEKIQAIYGIVNGTCNYILTEMTDQGKKFSDVLAEAQRLGYAEADPTLDVEGADSAHKLAVLTNLAFGTPVPLKEIYTEGVDRVTPVDIAFAEEFGYKIKLLAIAKLADGEIEARVHPTMIPKEYLLSRVEGVHNAVYIVGESVGELLFYGRGAGSLPTGSAVVSDLIDIARNILKETSGRVPPAAFIPSARTALRIKRMEEIESLYYLRFMAEDRPGVLSKISGILGRHKISISSVIQQGRKAGGNVPLVMMSHRAKERDIQEALSKINRMDYVSQPTVLIRVEGEDE
ncbi:MAG TPA: homoserine dehydrogenase [Candidatus Manganitrophaceae bacterium]|nr:homoserine dehydrogenase [Candidatus Manganitrophaceae bacterium]